MNRYEVQIVTRGRVQSCSTHRVESGCTENSNREKSPHSDKRLRIVRVKVVDNHTLSLTLSDGRVILRDCADLMRRAKGVLLPLRDPKYFRRVRVVHGALTWPREVDLCPDSTIYGKNWLHSRTVPKSMSI